MTLSWLTGAPRPLVELRLMPKNPERRLFCSTAASEGASDSAYSLARDGDSKGRVGDDKGTSRGIEPLRSLDEPRESLPPISLKKPEPRLVGDLLGTSGGGPTPGS
jgi:hypothetical protein